MSSFIILKLPPTSGESVSFTSVKLRSRSFLDNQNREGPIPKSQTKSSTLSRSEKLVRLQKSQKKKLRFQRFEEFPLLLGVSFHFFFSFSIVVSFRFVSFSFVFFRFVSSRNTVLRIIRSRRYNNEQQSKGRRQLSKMTKKTINKHNVVIVQYRTILLIVISFIASLLCCLFIKEGNHHLIGMFSFRSLIIHCVYSLLSL